MTTDRLSGPQVPAELLDPGALLCIALQVAGLQLAS